jgi:DNA polymerase III alpha subunit
MIPIFKSHFSIGKSILTLADPAEQSEGGSESIFSILQDNNLSQLVLVEDCPTGFLQAKKLSEAQGVHLIFGLRFNICPNMEKANDKKELAQSHKIIIFAKNDNGCKLLNKIYSAAFTEGFGCIDLPHLEKLWDDKLLKLAIPFYDSFIFQNLMSYNTCVPHFNFSTPTFFIEKNGLPFDPLIEDRVTKYCDSNKYKTEVVKSIYYNKKADFEAFQTYKCICSRSFTGRNASLSKPQLDHCGSDEFCVESWTSSRQACLN